MVIATCERKKIVGSDMESVCDVFRGKTGEVPSQTSAWSVL